MSILNSLASILEPVTSPVIGFPGDCKPDECDDDKQSKSNKDRNDDYSRNGNKDDYSNHNGKDDYSQHDKDDHSKHDKDDHSKQAKNDDCSDDGRKGDYSHQGKDDYSNHAGKDDHSNHGKDDYSKHDGGWQDAKNDNCQPQKDDCQPQPSDDCSKADTNHNPGEVLANCDFSHCDFGSQGADHVSDMQGALASMSSGHALDYAIGQLGSTDHFDIGHLDVPADTSHDMAHHA